MGLGWLMWTLHAVFSLFQKESINVYKDSLCSPPRLLVSNTSDIIAVNHMTGAVSPVISGLTRAVAIDVHFSLGYIFWSDVTEQNIKRYQIGGSVATIITDIGVCDGLAVDWRSSMLYWTDATNDTISMSDLEGNNQHTLVSLNLDDPRAIALDLDSSLMVWTALGGKAKIEKASLSGNQRVAIVTKHIYHPNGIELDRGNKRIYWVDAWFDRVESVDYNGNNRKQIFQQNGLRPFDLALFPPFLSFTDWNTLKVHKLDATTGAVISSYSINAGQPMGIVAHDYAQQPPGSSPCTHNNGGCSHFCVPKTSGYQCVCPVGVTVKKDGKTCGDRVTKFFLFTDAGNKLATVVLLDTDYLVVQNSFKQNGNQNPVAVDYDPVEGRVYWSDVEHGQIFSAFLNATSLQTLFHCNVQTPDGLAVDHVGRNIYWTDTGTNRIEVGRLDGTSRKLLFKDGLDGPRAIVLDQRNGMMYWTNCGANPKIERAGMDGSARQTIVTGNLGWPNGLTIDQATKRLYWADAYLNKIEMSDLDGGNRQLIVSYTSDIHPFGLEVYQDVLYWTDWNYKGIARYNLSSGSTDLIVSGLQKPMGIHVLDPSLIFSDPHNCSKDNGLCSDLCLLKPGGYQCACPTGVALKSDGKTCDHSTFHKTSSEKFMLIAEAYTKKLYKIPLSVRGRPCLPLGINWKIARPVAVDYDPVEGKIYWTDVILEVLARSFPNGSSVELIAHDKVKTPDGIAVDYVRRNIYWTDIGTSKIEVARLDGSFEKTLINSSIEKPRAILLDIVQSKMYWSDWGSSPKIEKANMDGSLRTTLVSSGLVWVNSLALDYQNRLLYWCDAGLNKIERVDLQGNNRLLILDLSLEKMHPFGLALSGDILYWSDWITKSVHQYNMKSTLRDILVSGMGQPMELHIYDHTRIFNETSTTSREDYYHWQIFVIVLGTALLALLIHFTIFCLRKRNLNNTPTNHNEKRTRENAGSRIVELQQFKQSMNGTRPNSRNSGTGARGSNSGASPEGIEENSAFDSSSKKSVEHDHKDDRTVTQRHCFIVRSHVGDKWKDVLRELSMDETTIKILELDYKDWGVSEKFYQGLLKWKDSLGPQKASIAKLSDALRRADCSEALNTLWKDNVGQSSQQNSEEPDRNDPGLGNSTTRVEDLTSAVAEDDNRGCHQDNEVQTPLDLVRGEYDNHNHSNNSPPVTQSHCLNIKDHIGVNWKDVLRELYMKETTIRNLEEDFKTVGVVEKCYQGLLLWMEIAGPQRATIDNLCGALRRVGCLEALQTLQGDM